MRPPLSRLPELLLLEPELPEGLSLDVLEPLDPLERDEPPELPDPL